MNKWFFLLLCTVMVFPLISSACKAQGDTEHIPGNVLAEVNGIALTDEDLSVISGGAHAAGVTHDKDTSSLENLIDQELLYLNGMELGLDRDAKYREMVRRMERRMEAAKRKEMARRVFNTQIAATVDVKNSDAKEFFDKNADQILTELRLGVLRFPDRTGAQSAYDSIQKGSSFESIASGLFPSSPRGAKEPWDLGFLKWSQIPQELRETVYALEVGQTSTVTDAGRSGFQIVKVLDKRKKKDTGYKELQGEIMIALRDQKINNAYKQYLKRLREEAKIVKFEERRNSHEAR